MMSVSERWVARHLAWSLRFFLLLLTALAPPSSWCSASLLVEEPFGHFGGMNPTGHAAVYLDHVCAETPLKLRMCEPGELGAVISRYHKVAGYDWLAIPLVPYLYAVDSPEEVPAFATEPIESHLRDTYRREHLRALAPDAQNGGVPEGEWVQLVGSSYDRTIHGFTVATTPEQDLRFIAEFNDRKNVSHFNLFFNNCADLSRIILGFYYPHSTHRNFVADVGFTTPKQLARTLTKYNKRHPEMELAPFLIPQVPGTIDRSRPVRGVLEALVRSKRYLVPLGYFQPELTGGMALAYLSTGRYRFPTDVPVITTSALRSDVMTGDLPDVSLLNLGVQPSAEVLLSAGYENVFATVE